MKKIAKYITSAILSVCLFCLSAIPALAYTEGYFRYEITDGVLTITEYFGREENVTVPNMIAGTPVSVIGENVFPEGCGVKRVNLPDTIMKVHTNSFAGSIAVVYNSNIATTTTTAAPQTETAPEIVTTPQNTATNPAVTSVSSTEKAPVITETRTENGAVYIEEEDDEVEPEDIGEGGMEEDEDVIIDITPSETSVPDYIVIAPGTGTVSEAVTTKLATTEESSVSTSANETGEAAVATDDNGEAATTAPEDKPTAEDGAIIEAGDNAPAPEISPEAPTEKPQNNNMLVSVIIYTVAVIAVAAVVIIVLAKRKK